MPTEPASSASDDDAQPQRLHRLGEAMDALLQWRARGPRADREQFLRDHADLRDLLEPMLDDAGAEADEEPPAIDPVAMEPGRCLGDYRLVREVGRGGMGTVYEAQQISLQRRVALKVLHSHLAWSPKSIARFRHEAAAAGRLNHPAVVPIHEVGECQGLHYFSMEFVIGRPLHEILWQARLGVRGDCSRAAEAAELVARVADALQHAHEQGLVHRDVKPHNVMVDGEGQVRLLDFGLAKSLDAHPHSVTGEFLGTPHYCSPEQITAGATVGPASDIFSLGIVLYELLARRRPFDGETARLVMQRIEAGDFEPLRKVEPSVPRDLQTICHKALELDPRNRYATAGAFAADLRRFLRIEPIHAAPPGVLVRAGKWIRRHRLPVALGALLVTTAIGAPIGYALHLQRTNAVIGEEREVLDRAEELGFQSIEQTLSLLAEQLDRQPGPGSRQEPRVDAVVALCENFLLLRSDLPQRRGRIAHAFYVLAGIYAQLGRTEAALAACDRSRQLLTTASDADPASTETQLGRILLRELHTRQLAEASGGEEEFARASAHWRELAQRPGADPRVVTAYAETLLVRSRALGERPNRRLEAERLLNQGLGMLTPALVAADPAARSVALRSRAVLGQVMLTTGRAEAAVEMLREVVAAMTQLPLDPVLGVERTLAVASIGHALQRLKKPVEAEAALREAIAMATGYLQQFPGSQQLRRRLLSSRTVLGSQLLVQGKIEAAEAILREAATGVDPAASTASGGNSWMERALLADLDIQLGNCILMRSSTGAAGEEATQLFRQACDLLEVLIEEQPKHTEFRVDLGTAWNSLASHANEVGQHAAAVDFARRAVAQQEAALQLSPQDGRARVFLGIHQGHLAYALAHVAEGPAALQAGKAALANAPRQVATLRLVAQAGVRVGRTTTVEVTPDGTEAGFQLAVSALEQIGEVQAKELRRLLPDQRFAALRGRTDFEQLCTQYEIR